MTFTPLTIEKTDYTNPAHAIPWDVLLPEHLSASSLKTYMRCRESWRRKYICKEREASAHYFVWGGAHNFALVETNYAQKITTGVDLPLKDVQEAFVAGVEQETAQADGEVDWREWTPGKIKDSGVKLVSAYHTKVSPTVQPLAVEEKFTVEVPGVPVPLIGYIDVREKSKIDDLKTAKTRKVTGGDLFQSAVYQLAHPLPVDLHIATKTVTPAVYTSADDESFGLRFGGTSLVEAKVRNLAVDIVATLERYGPDQPWPGAYTAGDNPCDRCSFQSSCAWWA
jgi:hypothetical protein